MSSRRLFRRIRFICVLLAVLFSSLSFWYFSPFFSPGENRRFASYIQKRFLAEAASSTLSLHYTLSDPASFGISDSSPSFGTISLPDRTRTDTFCKETRKMLSSFSSSRLSLENQITRDLLLYDLSCEELPGSTSLLAEPLGPSLGIQAQMPILLSEYAFRSPEDVRDYLRLLEDLPRYFSQIIALEQEKSSRGIFLNDAAVDGVVAQCRSFLSNPENNILQTTFQARLAETGFFPQEEQTRCLSVHKKLLDTCVFPAYQNLISALLALRGNGVATGGLSCQPDGIAYYQYLLQSRVGILSTSSELSERLTKQLTSDLAEIQTLLNQNPGLSLSEDAIVLPFSSPEEMLLDLQNAMASDFPLLTGSSYQVKTVDNSLSAFLSPAFYLTPPLDASSENSIYINPAQQMENLELYSTLAHEGFPGHLYQTVGFARTGAPAIRYLYAPSGYVEGWATYVESYACTYAARNLDTQTQTLCRLWYLNRSVHLCLYSLLDLGIHSQSWQLPEVMSFLSRFGITDRAAASSIYQYICETPANYLKYYVGALSFFDLRSREQNRLGADFSTRAFHRALMSLGPLPFSLLEKYLPVMNS